MKSASKVSIALMLAAGICVQASVDNAPISNGTTTGRNMLGSAPEAPSQNPALLGCDRVPFGGFLLVPVTNYGVGFWSDKLALSPFTILSNIPTDKDKSKALINAVLVNSFDITSGMSDTAVARKIAEKFKGGATIYSGFRTSILSIAHRRWAFDVTTHMDQELRIPEAPLLLVFSPTKTPYGLQRGNTLDFSNFNQQGIWATDFTFQLGLPVKIPALHDFFKLNNGAGGVGVKYVMGHSMLKASSSPGTHITYDSVNNVLKMDGQFTLQTAGVGLHGPWKIDKNGPFANGLPVNGHGIGVEIGGILYDERGAMSINVQNLGVLFWTNNVKTVTYKVKKENLDAYSLIRGIDQYKDSPDSAINSLFGNWKAGETFPTSRDTLANASSAVATFLPLSLNIGYARVFDFTKSESEFLRRLADYANVAANYEQALAPGPGRSFIPRLSIGSELGTFRHFLPLRLGFIAGGPEHWASAFGFGFNFRYFSIQASYKAIGNWWLAPSRGFELAGGLNVNWGMRIAPPEPPREYDQDHDGIPDSLDKCPLAPEDKDGYEDADGCPDYDNDMDGIPDSVDRCANLAEDMDNYQDQDGCPDGDNDMDGIPDTLDKCYNVAEDIDGFEDADGCPDYDNDTDGIPDTLDKCPNEPETFNGYKDDDGCPDTLIKPTVKEMQILNTKLRDINFKTASAELLPESFAALDYAVGFLKQYPNLKYEVQGHTDSRGEDDYNLVLSAARAGSVRAYLFSKGIPDSSLIAIGYGETMPVADNKTAKGRALNRRVEFKFIESAQDYSALKVKEAMFRERIKEAKIKGGAQY